MPVSPDGVYEIFYITNAIAESAQVDGASDGNLIVTYNLAKKVVEHWRAKYPASPTAAVALAELHNARGWHERGMGFSDSVDERQEQTFENELSAAWDILESTRAFATENPAWFATAEQVGKGLGMDRDEYVQIVDEGMHRFPDIQYLATQGAFYMAPRWGGSDQAVKRYTDHVLANAKPEDRDIIYGEIYGAFLMMRWYDPKEITSKLGVDIARVEKGYAENYRRYPQPYNRDLQASAYCHAYDIANVAPLMDEIGDSPLPQAWSGSDDPAFYQWCLENVARYKLWQQADNQ